MDNGASSYRRYLDGDESAFEELEKIYFSRLVFFIKGYVRQEDAAEDIAIDTFVELVLHPGRYNFKNSFSTYLFAIAHHKALNYIKHVRRRQSLSFDAAYDIAGGEQPEEALEKEERSARLREEMDRLPQELYTALYLVYFEDMTYDEAAKVMKKNKKQVYNLIYRAKAELRDSLGDEEL